MKLEKQTVGACIDVTPEPSGIPCAGMARRWLPCVGGAVTPSVVTEGVLSIDFPRIFRQFRKKPFPWGAPVSPQGLTGVGHAASTVTHYAILPSHPSRQAIFPKIRATLTWHFFNHNPVPDIEKASEFSFGGFNVGNTYLPGKSPCKYCRRR